MPVNEKGYLHVRLNKSNARKIKKISKRTHRSLNVEANLAVAQYRPKTVVFRDNGK